MFRAGPTPWGRYTICSGESTSGQCGGRGRFVRQAPQLETVVGIECTSPLVTSGDVDAVVAKMAGGADVVLTWSDAPRSAAIQRAMRRAGMSQVFIGSHEIMSDEFAALAGSEPGSVLALCPPARRMDHAAAARFADDYMQRFKRPPRPGGRGIGSLC